VTVGTVEADLQKRRIPLRGIRKEARAQQRTSFFASIVIVDADSHVMVVMMGSNPDPHLMMMVMMMVADLDRHLC
jgi:hypothetical protein